MHQRWTNNILALLALILLQQTATLAQEQEKQMDFPTALQQIKSDSKAMKSAQMNEKYFELKRKAAYGLYMPSIGLTADFTHFDDDIHLDLRDTKEEAATMMGQLATGMPDYAPLIGALAPALDQMLPNKYIIQEQNMSFVSSNLLWPLFTGGKIHAANQKAKLDVQQAQKQTKAAEEGLVTELVERYFGLRLALEAEKVFSDVSDAMQQHLDEAKKLEENGMISEAERLHAAVAQADANRELQNAKSTIGTLKDALKNTLNDSTTIIPSSELFMVNELESLSYFQQKALENNIQLQMVETKKEMAHVGKIAARADYMPTIAAMGYWRLWTAKEESILPDWLVGVTLTWNIFDGAARTHKYLAAKKLEERVGMIEDKAQDDIKTLVTKRYNELQSHAMQLKALDATAKFAEEYVRVRQKAFREGFATSTEVVDAELTLSRVKIGRLKAMYDYDLALAKLLQTAGLSHEFETYRTK